METIKNKVAESGIITFDLSKYLTPDKDIVIFDLKPFLFRELILKEKDYRESLSTHDWQQYEGKHIALFCSTDAILPVWAFMLATSYLQPVAKSVFMGTVTELQKSYLQHAIQHIDADEYNDKRVVIKGCGDVAIPDAAYVAITEKLRPVVKSLMYGEPCSTVPLYKKPAIKPAG
jgi:hypothetical protein